MSKVKRISSQPVTQYCPTLVLKQTLLLLLPIPTAVNSFFQFIRLDFTSGWVALLCSTGFIAASILTTKSIALEKQTAPVTEPSRKNTFAWKRVGTAIFGISTAFSLMALTDSTIMEAGVGSIIALLIFALLFGAMTPEKEDLILPPVTSSNQAMVKEARSRLAAIKDTATHTETLKDAGQLQSLIEITETIIIYVENSHQENREVRKILKVYLPQVAKIINNYRTVDYELISEEAKSTDQLSSLLSLVESDFKKVYRKLMENQAINIDLDMKVLQTRLDEERRS